MNYKKIVRGKEMQKETLYDVLEVSEKASSEVIEKAYKVLVKKYHPDLQTANNKEHAETMMKKINEAYDILSDDTKRKEYDNKLIQIRQQEEMAKQNFQEYETTNNEYNQENLSKHSYYAGSENSNSGYRSNQNNSNKPNNASSYKRNYEAERAKYEKKLMKEEMAQRKKMQENLNREYQNAYENYLRNLGYKVKHSWTKENIKDIFIVIAIMIVIIVILWFIPPTHDWMVEFYEKNPIIKTIINIIVTIVTSIFTAIWEFITSLFS